MNKSCLYLLICFSLLTLNTGRASFHDWDINEVYSNADGSVQFIELFTSSNGQEFLSGHKITSTGAPDFIFPSNSPSPTGGHHLLIATGDINGVAPDYIIPANFLTTGPGTVNFVGADLLSYSFLPINGFSSIDGNGDIFASATPTNFSGSTTTLTGNGTPMTFTVNSTNDVNDGTCDGTHCSLREAIIAANGNAGLDTIAFAITGSGPHSIAPTSPLPTITDPVVIDGATEPDFSGTPVIELNGSGAGASANGLHITAGGCTLRGLAVNRFSFDGIVLETNGDNRIEGCFIGTSTDGLSDLGNTLDGVFISESSGNTIGGAVAGARNVISGNGDDGVDLDGSGSTDNRVIGNYIGTDATGAVDLGNSDYGVEIDNGASNNTVGGSGAGEGNVVSGNDDDGFHIDGSTTTGNTVLGNYIGTDVSGTADLGNSGDGVEIHQGASSNTIGGTTAGARNIISGNEGEGVLIEGSGTSGNTILGNYIGTDVNGTAALGNDSDGVNIVLGASNNTVGGTTAGAGNVISENSGAGIEIDNPGTAGNAVLGNSIFSNGLLGIDLGGDNVNANDSGDEDTGPNNLQNAPEITSAEIDLNDDLVIQYEVDSDPSHSAYPLTIEFFESDAGGEGQLFLGTDTYTAADFASGVKTINLGNVLSILGVTDKTNAEVATATDDNGNTSEFSSIDTDGDGMPNAWEEFWGLDFDDLSDGPGNPDGDPFSNLEEFLSSTNPFDLESALRITAIVFVGPDFSISFTTAVSRRYSVEYTDVLVAGNWMTLEGNIIGTGGIVQVTDVGILNQPTQFYRVQVLN